MTAEPFRPPVYPYERLAGAQKLAQAHEGGMVDLSIGTPNDAPPPAVVAALSSSNAERGYPASVGNAGYREAASGWMRRRLGVTVEPAAVYACVGTKEFVTTLPHWLHLRRPDLDTVLYPAVSYPSYAMGATLAGCRAVAVPVDERWRLDLSAIDETDAARALCLWVNTPGNPAGQVEDLAAAAGWGRAHGVPVFSDECYVEFTWPTTDATGLRVPIPGVLHERREPGSSFDGDSTDPTGQEGGRRGGGGESGSGGATTDATAQEGGRRGGGGGSRSGGATTSAAPGVRHERSGSASSRRTILEHGPEGVVAVHSLSKRSNLAGLRAGFYAGDADLTHYLSEVRKHVGMLMPGPVQAAGAVALGDDEHVEAQRELYRERIEVFAGILGDLGVEAPEPEGGFYLWAPVPDGDAWGFAERLARDGGCLVSPGDLYGAAGAGHVRVALVQPVERLALVAERLARSG
ncbi:MAG TPA: aminotransferase class I/II-fold pyridoxal phosphate-dependent enzyme [Acidimicrobiales bacterium]|nr:aminotransferase class I/II-fold pyridoxal phosphate-dependent enzyme [Acidimicrobiales bacterium]